MFLKNRNMISKIRTSKVTDYAALKVTLFLMMYVYATGPFKDFPQVTVYHPDSAHGHAFANIGWTGWIGSITGDV